MRGVYHKSIFLSLVLVIGILFSLNFVLALDCWLYDSDQSSCEDLGCKFNSDDWGSWCEEKGCWNYWNESGCPVTIPGTEKNCQWQSGTGMGWCERTSCWSFQTNQTLCDNSTLNGGLNCQYSNNCNGPSDLCWGKSVDECNNLSSSGCYVGECNEIACWNFWEEEECINATGSKGQSCQWNSDNNYCYETSCWDYSGTT